MKSKSQGRFVYIVASDEQTLYTGHINDLRLAVHRHRTKESPGQYRRKKLVYFEVLPSADAARSRAREIRSWTRKAKLELIASTNPKWTELIP